MEKAPDKIAEFLYSLNELSRITGIAIAGSPVLFQMEPEDTTRNYQLDDDSRLSFS